MHDPRVEKLAKILVDYSIAVKSGDWVVVRGSSLAFPLIEAVVRNVYQAGGHPTTLIENDALEEIHLRDASEPQLQWVSPLETLAFQKMDALITIARDREYPSPERHRSPKSPSQAGCP